MSRPKPKPEPKPRGTHGGARPGAGRKPKASTVLRDTLRQTKASDAEYGYNLFAATMKRVEEETEIRLDAAREIMNRVWGKPPQAVIVDMSGKVTASLANEDRKLLDGLSAKLGDSPVARQAAADALLHAAEAIEPRNLG